MKGFIFATGTAETLPTHNRSMIIVTVLTHVVLLLVLIGVKQLKEGTTPVPTETIASVKQDVNAIKGIGKRD